MVFYYGGTNQLKSIYLKTDSSAVFKKYFVLLPESFKNAFPYHKAAVFPIFFKKTNVKMGSYCKKAKKQRLKIEHEIF